MSYRHTGVTPDDIRVWLGKQPNRTQADAMAHFDVSLATVQNATNHRIGQTERDVYAAIGKLIAKHGWAPSTREIAKATGRGPAHVHHAIAKLAYAGYIVKGNGPRMLRLTNKEMT
jgi:DNA-binding MarR family transcriptional regulator